jgi:hypothetical protein
MPPPPIIFTAGGAWENNSSDCFGSMDTSWKTRRVEAKDRDPEMGTSPWGFQRRKRIWLARFGVEIAKCNARVHDQPLSAL